MSMVLGLERLPKRMGAILTLSGFAMIAALLFVAMAVPGLATAPSGRSVRAKTHAIAVAAGGQYSLAAFNKAFGDMDPSMLSYAYRYTPTPEALTGDLGGLSAEAMPAFSARALQSLSWDSARLVNASIPFSNLPNPAAQPFRLHGAAEDRARAIECLSQAVYYEAAYESAEGQAAVAQVVLNRLRHPLFPKTVCGVVYQGSELPTGCQFTFTCDGALARAPLEPLWSRARQVAERALAGHVVKSVGNATHYHANYVVPYWLPSLTKISQIGTHIFYRWSGGMGLPGAFSGRYAGAEPVIGNAAVALAAAQAAAKADAEIIARVGKVEETPAAAPIQLAAAPSIVTAEETEVVLAQTELKLEAPKVRLPQRGAAFAIQRSCVSSTLGNCPTF